jgi:hypothetical protein
MSDRKGGFAGLVLVALLLASAGGAGFALWRWKRGPEIDIPVLAVEQYLRLKADGRVKEAWLEDGVMDVELQDPLVLGDRAYKWIRVLASGVDSAQLRQGLPRERFHEAP